MPRARPCANANPLRCVYREAGTTTIFDGDGLSDTPDEPIWDVMSTRGSTAETKLVATYNLPGSSTYDLRAPLKNIMSYYYNQTRRISPKQGIIVRALMGIRFN